MSTFKYYSASAAFGQGQINWLTDDIRGMLVSATYAPSQAHDQFVSDIPSQAIIVRSAQMTAPAIVNGVCRGTVPEFDALLATTPVVALVLYKNTNNDTTSQLIYYSDGGIGFPFLPAGLNYFVGYDLANGGWFQL